MHERNEKLRAVDKDDPRPRWCSDWGTDHGAATNNLQADVLTNHGPLGALYPTNKGLPEKEDDTMTFLAVLHRLRRGDDERLGRYHDLPVPAELADGGGELGANAVAFVAVEMAEHDCDRPSNAV